MRRTVFLDMGNVLVWFSHERMCAQVASVFNCEPAAVHAVLFEDGLQQEFESGRVTEADLRHKLESQLESHADPDHLRRAVSDIFEVNREIVPLLDELKRKGSRLILLSNTNVIHFEFIRSEFDILDWFDDFILSYEVGSLKPHPEIFRFALQRAAVGAEDCFFTDDILENVEQARLLGIAAEVFTDSTTLEHQLRALNFI